MCAPSSTSAEACLVSWPIAYPQMNSVAWLLSLSMVHVYLYVVLPSVSRMNSSPSWSSHQREREAGCVRLRSIEWCCTDLVILPGLKSLLLLCVESRHAWQLSIIKLSISRWSQIVEDTIEPSCLPENLIPKRAHWASWHKLSGVAGNWTQPLRQPVPWWVL